jgi:DNA helicase-2/ATP-dependent DNA helicase PcrA
MNMDNIYDTLNERQREAVFQTDGPVLILAGAGSGKTRTLTHRIAYLIEEMGVNPWNILAITFTNKAAKEMRERVDKVVGIGADNVWVSTFHSMCVRILRRYIDRIGYDTNFTIYDTDDQKNVVKEIIKRLNLDSKMFKERAVLGAISAAKDRLETPEDMRINAAGNYNDEVVARIYAEYQKALMTNNALDFDDLIVKTVELFDKDYQVLDSYQERFVYIMVDEYQDTNTAQFRLVSRLAEKYRNLCVVGDDDQSIYKFRGANIQNILSFEKVFPGARVIRLEQNYRSTQNILNAANHVIAHNEGRKKKTLWTDNPEGDRVHFNLYDDAYTEGIGVAGMIRSRVRDGYRYSDIAVLYRTNAQSRALEEKLLAGNIPYHIYGGVNFYQRKEIKDILSYLKTIDNGRDGQAVKRIINVPKRGIGATTVNRIQEFADGKGISFYEALVQAENIPSLGRSASKLQPFITYVCALKARAASLSIQQLVEDMLDELDYYDYLAETDTPDELEARRQNIDEFISKIVTYEDECRERDEKPTLTGFLAEVALVAEIDSMDANSDHVTLMTIHSAKGLEFPIVFLTGMEDGLFPGYMSINGDDPDELEEERRLCYVGITRAMRELYLSAARMRMVRGETQYNKVSRFIKEIPDSLVEMKQESSGPASIGRQQNTFMGGAGKSHANGVGAYMRQSGASMYMNRSGSTSAGNQGNGGNRASGAASYLEGSKANSKVGFGKEFPMGGFAGTAGSFNEKMAGNAGYTLAYGVGDRVLHGKFGEGTVVSVVEGARDYEVSVDFDRDGRKKLLAGFAS